MPAEVAQLSVLAAFAGGVLSFLSPCVAPLVPGYLSLISGASIDGEASPAGGSRRVLAASLLFVMGFTLVFVTLGASASLAGGLINSYRYLLVQVAGGVMILMGLLIVGALQMPWLLRERRFHPKAHSSLSRSETMLLGMAFGFGWSPCIGPLLASILVYTSAAETVGRGTLLLLAYSLGLGVPFVAVGLGFGRGIRTIRWVTRHSRAVSMFSGGTLILLGVVFISGRFFYFNGAAQRFYYQVIVPVTQQLGL